MTVCPTCSGGAIIRLLPARRASGDRMALRPWVVGCRDCGLVFNDPLVHPNQAEYGPDGPWAKGHRFEYKAAPGDLRKSSHTEIAAAIDSLSPQDRSLLDIGCGRGHLVQHYHDRGWRAAGMDSAAAPYLRKVGLLAVDEIPRDSDYSVVVLNHVLEHLTDPLEMLSRARRAIRDGGHIIVGTPSLDGLVAHRRIDYCINRTRHLSAFTRASMAHLLARAGFDVVVDLPPSLPKRQALLAVARTCKPVSAPLGDAEREFRAYAGFRRHLWPVGALPALAAKALGVVRSLAGVRLKR